MIRLTQKYNFVKLPVYQRAQQFEMTAIRDEGPPMRFQLLTPHHPPIKDG